MLSKEARGYPVYGLIISIFGSPEYSWSVDEVMKKFYQSGYFNGYGLMPIKKEGF